MQEDEEGEGVFLRGGSAEHRHHRLVCGVFGACGRGLVSAPIRSGHLKRFIINNETLSALKL